GTGTNECKHLRTNHFGPDLSRCYNPIFRYFSRATVAWSLGLSRSRCWIGVGARVRPTKRIFVEDRLMKCLTRPALLLLILSLSMPGFADQAKTLYEKGADAEARQNYEQAFDFFKQAYNLKPKDLRYRA